MQKILIIALVALCAAFQGEVRAEMTNTSILQTEICQDEGNTIVVEWILNQVVDQTGLTYDEVRSMYEDGSLTIEIVDNGYLVSLVSTAEGGIMTIISIDEL